MIALVTGGTGFIGSHLVERLLADGHEVHALVRDPARPRWLRGRNDVRLVPGDLGAVPRLPPGLGCVFHLAGLTKAARSGPYYSVNRDGTQNLVRSVLGQGLRPAFIHMSSLAAGGPSHPDGTPRREEEPPAPVSPYGDSKRAAEDAVLAARGETRVAVLRIAAVYGPRDEDFLEYFRTIKKGLLPRFGRRPRPLSVIFVRDLVEAMVRAAERDLPSGEILNVAAEAPSTWEEIGDCAARVMGRKALRLRIPMAAVWLAAAGNEALSRLRGKASPVNLSKYRDLRQPGWAADVTKAARLLGFRAATPLETGLRETIRWYEETGRL